MALSCPHLAAGSGDSPLHFLFPNYFGDSQGPLKMHRIRGLPFQSFALRGHLWVSFPRELLAPPVFPGNQNVFILASPLPFQLASYIRRPGLSPRFLAEQSSSAQISGAPAAGGHEVSS